MSSAESSQPPHILLVEDDNDIRESIADMLTERGYCVAATASGSDALRYLDGHLETGLRRRVVVVLDLLMPGMDGRTFLRELERREALAELPVVVITAQPESKIGEIRHARNVKAVVAKPFSIETLRDALERVGAA